MLREGNVIVLAHASLEVVEACSGLRSVLSLLTLALILGYFADSRQVVRVCLVSLSIPIAILVNGVRIAGTGIAAQYVGPEGAEGFFHTFSGWVIFVLSFALLVAAHRVIVRVLPSRTVPHSVGLRT